MSAAPAVSQEGPLALICGGGSLPLAVADFVAARGRKVLLFPLRGAAEAGDLARSASPGSAFAQFGKFVRAGARRRLPRHGVYRIAGAAVVVASPLRSGGR